MSRSRPAFLGRPTQKTRAIRALDAGAWLTSPTHSSSMAKRRSSICSYAKLARGATTAAAVIRARKSIWASAPTFNSTRCTALGPDDVGDGQGTGHTRAASAALDTTVKTSFSPVSSKSRVI